VIRRTPASCARRASSGALMVRWSHPSRIFSVTGTDTAAMVASINDRAWSRSRISAEPDCPPVTCRAGQPMLMSMMAAPQASAIRAASPIQRASHPANCTTCVRRPRPSARNRASGRPWASAPLAVISETTNPAPRSAARRRNGASVIPDIGAKITGFGSVRLPMTTGRRREKGTTGGT
jgi:hypothetical protein